MPHRCAGCNTLFPDARHFRDGCPVCGCGKFVFEVGRRRVQKREPALQNHEPDTPAPTPAPLTREPEGVVQEEPLEQDPDSIESIRILEPGRYDLNLSRLVETDDRVVRVGSEDTYRLDLHSMIRQKKKNIILLKIKK